MAALLAESETEAEKDLAASREPSAEEQKAMWGGSSGTLSNTQPMAIGDIASGMSGASSPESEATPLEISEEEFSSQAFTAISIGALRWPCRRSPQCIRRRG